MSDEQKHTEGPGGVSGFGPFPVGITFGSRRSPVLTRNVSVASSQPLATEAGLRILREGGNAADAAVAVAAALNVTEPCSTGIGGDCFALYYDAATRKVTGLNGSGRCAAALTPEEARRSTNGADALPEESPHSVTVPGAAAGWLDTLERWGTGKLSAAQVLAPAIELAEGGFPVAPLTAVQFHRGAGLLGRQMRATGQESVPFLPGGRPPKAGDVMTNPELAATFRRLAEGGKEAFYGAGSETARAIVETLRSVGSLLEASDLEAHRSTFPEPIRVRYGGVDVWEIPPNGQGLAALLALNTLEGTGMGKLAHNSAEYLHRAIEAMRLAFADARWYVADPDVVHVPVAELLSPEYAARRRAEIVPGRATADVKRGSPCASSDTVQFVVVDREGNACSFINSNYSGFGSGIVARGCGFTLQSRGANFSLVDGHPNVLAGGKRPYHTILPMMTTWADGRLHCAGGCMGGFMQPQGHLQLVMNMVDFGLGPQAALDMPRFCIADGTANGLVSLEEGIDEEVVRRLEEMGHRVRLVRGIDRLVFGRGQIIRRLENGVLFAGSDPRADGCAMGF